jgi:hypothetical protein
VTPTHNLKRTCMIFTKTAHKSWVLVRKSQFFEEKIRTHKFRSCVSAPSSNSHTLPPIPLLYSQTPTPPTSESHHFPLYSLLYPLYTSLTTSTIRYDPFCPWISCSVVIWLGDFHKFGDLEFVHFSSGVRSIAGHLLFFLRCQILQNLYLTVV